MIHPFRYVLLFYCWQSYYCALCHWAFETGICLFRNSIFWCLRILMCHTTHWNYLILYVDLIYYAFCFMSFNKSCFKTNVFSRRRELVTYKDVVVNYNNYCVIIIIFLFQIWYKNRSVNWTQSLQFLLHRTLFSFYYIFSACQNLVILLDVFCETNYRFFEALHNFMKVYIIRILRNVTSWMFWDVGLKMSRVIPSALQWSNE
jgi:hypothetical protein